jgi:6-phosphofructokinase 1
MSKELTETFRVAGLSHNRLFFVEVMGRDAGHIALNAGIGAGAEEILIPEENLGLDRLIDSLRKSKESGKTSSIVVVAEGDKIGKNVFELKDYVEENMPEYDVRVSVLGHMQRGGTPSCFDRVLASRLGVKAVETLLEGKTNLMVGLLQDKVALTPLDQAIKGQSRVDAELVKVSDIISI